MKNKNIVIAVVALAVIITGIIFMGKMNPVNKNVKPQAKTKAPGMAKAVAKKTFSKDAGGLTVKIANYKGTALDLRGSAFMSRNSRSSIYKGELTSNRMKELPQGTYDIVMNTTPRIIYKGISVSAGRETVEDMGSMGAITVKILNSKKLAASYPVQVFLGKSTDAAISGITNRPIAVIPGTYEIQVGTIPPSQRKAIEVGPGKEAVEDLGCVTGSITVKVVDKNGKDVRAMFAVKKAGTNNMVTGGSANNTVDITEGLYDVEVLLKPSQIKSGVKIVAGENSIIEFTAAEQIPQPLKQKTAPSVRPVK